MKNRINKPLFEMQRAERLDNLIYGIRNRVNRRLDAHKS